MPTPAQVLCVYRYDALDRLAGAMPAGQGSVERFYQKNRLATEVQGQIKRSLLLTDDHLLAQLTSTDAKRTCALLATDQQRSVLHSVEALQRLAFQYMPYGFRKPAVYLPGFNGEQADAVTGDYLLGSGYRAFNPVLMRFNSPDSLSPFGEGGLNAYGYCVGDPVNRVDPTGYTWQWLKMILRSVGVMKKSLSEPTLLKVRNRKYSLVSGNEYASSMGAYAISAKNQKIVESVSESGHFYEAMELKVFDSIFSNDPITRPGRVIGDYFPMPKIYEDVREGNLATVGILRTVRRGQTLAAEQRARMKLERSLLIRGESPTPH